MVCEHCGKDQPVHQFYDKAGFLVAAELVTTNSARSWTKRVCFVCWHQFQERSFAVIKRIGNTFQAISAF
jgi:hypothetical protein